LRRLGAGKRRAKYTTSFRIASPLGTACCNAMGKDLRTGVLFGFL
jgi:hypothetical protein